MMAYSFRNVVIYLVWSNRRIHKYINIQNLIIEIYIHWFLAMGVTAIIHINGNINTFNFESVVDILQRICVDYSAYISLEMIQNQY